MAPVIANAALCCTDSILFENDILDGRSKIIKIVKMRSYKGLMNDQ